MQGGDGHGDSALAADSWPGGGVKTSPWLWKTACVGWSCSRSILDISGSLSTPCCAVSLPGSCCFLSECKSVPPTPVMHNWGVPGFKGTPWPEVGLGYFSLPHLIMVIELFCLLSKEQISY